MAVAERMTAEEYLALPVPWQGRPRTELIDGEVVVSDPTMHHGDCQGAIYSALKTWAEAEPGRGKVALPCDVELDERNVYEPDVLWYRESRVPDARKPPPYPLPDLGVEVRSPSTWRYDVGRKRAVYEAGGLPELWLVDTVAESVLVFRRSARESPHFDVALECSGAERLDSPLMAGFALPVRQVFPPQ